MDRLPVKPYTVIFARVRGKSGQFVVMAGDKKSAIKIAWKQLLPVSNHPISKQQA
jgi:hypothetical protein